MPENPFQDSDAIIVILSGSEEFVYIYFVYSDSSLSFRMTKQNDLIDTCRLNDDLL